MDQYAATNDTRDVTHVLIVEDERMCALIMSEVIRILGFRATIVKSACEALTVLGSSRVDLITLDIRLAGNMDGWRLAKLIRNSGQEYSNVPIVAVTTHSFVEDIERSRSLGINRHVTKPFHLKHMMHVITELLQARSMDTNGSEARRLFDEP